MYRRSYQIIETNEQSLIKVLNAKVFDIEDDFGLLLEFWSFVRVILMLVCMDCESGDVKCYFFEWIFISTEFC